MKVTAEDINALPENIRFFVMELESMSDASGYVRRIFQLEDENKALQAVIRQLKGGSPI